MVGTKGYIAFGSGGNSGQVKAKFWLGAKSAFEQNAVAIEAGVDCGGKFSDFLDKFLYIIKHAYFLFLKKS